VNTHGKAFSAHEYGYLYSCTKCLYISGDTPEKGTRGAGKKTPWLDSFLRRTSSGPDTVYDEFPIGRQDVDLLH